MNTYDQTNIKNNIIYFPLWRVKRVEYIPWTWESRYLNLVSLPEEKRWSHNCRSLGAITLSSKRNQCSFCGALKENEPSEDAILEYMDTEYE